MDRPSSSILFAISFDFCNFASKRLYQYFTFKLAIGNTERFRNRKRPSGCNTRCHKKDVAKLDATKIRYKKANNNATNNKYSIFNLRYVLNIDHKDVKICHQQATKLFHFQLITVFGKEPYIGVRFYAVPLRFNNFHDRAKI